MGSVCCSREVLQVPDAPAPAPPAPEMVQPLQVESLGHRDSCSSKGPRQRRTSMAQGRSVKDQLGFEVYRAHQNETEWLNEVVRRLWEYIEDSIEKLLFQDITMRIREECASVPILKNFTFTQFTFGSERPKFSQMKVRYKGNLLEIFVEMDWDAPKSEIAVSLGSVKLGMQHIQLSGSILLVLSPLLRSLPLMGGLSITFPDPPKLTWRWSGAAGLGITGIAGALQEVMALNIKEIIVQAIFETLVVPSRVYIDVAKLSQSRQSLEPDERIENFRSPDPIGVLQVVLLEARDLPAADFGFGGGSSDPYVVVKVGTTSFTSVKRVKTLNPQWGRAHAMDFLVYHMEQHLFVDVFDSDLLSKDDRLGYVVANGRRPRVNDLDELQEEKDWDLHEGGTLRMICRFRELSGGDVVEPHLVQCNEQCRAEGLVKSKSLRACSLCGEGSVLKLMRCGSCFSDPGRYECPACGFKCCRTCWYDRRPAAAMLRVCLREGLVPKEDAKAGVRLGVCVEGGAPQWSSVSTRPTYEDLTEQSEAQRWIQNLCRRFDRASVAHCLEISAERIQAVLDEARDVNTEKVDFLGQEPVIWDHALHFLIRQPSPDMSLGVLYKSARGVCERQVPLSKKLHSGEPSATGSPMEVTWTFPLESDTVTASVFVEVTLQGLLR